MLEKRSKTERLTGLDIIREEGANATGRTTDGERGSVEGEGFNW